MSSQKIKWWKTPPYSNVVGGLMLAAILGLLRLGYEWVTATEVLLTFKGFWILVVSSFSYVLNYEFKFWWLLIAFIFFALIRFIYLKVIQKSAKNIAYELSEDFPSNDDYDKLHKQMDRDEARLQRMLQYTAGKFFNNVWVWKWTFNRLIHQYEIKNILPVCDKEHCDQNPMRFMSGDSFGYLYHCDECKKSKYFKENTIEIETVIENYAKII